MPPTKEDLLKLKLSGLLEQAKEAGVSQPEIDAFENGDLAKAEFVEVVLKAIDSKRELTLTLEIEKPSKKSGTTAGWAPLEGTYVVRVASVAELRARLFTELSKSAAGKKWLKDDTVGVDLSVRDAGSGTWSRPADVAAIGAVETLRAEQLRIAYAQAVRLRVGQPCQIDPTISGWLGPPGEIDGLSFQLAKNAELEGWLTIDPSTGRLNGTPSRV